MAFDKKLLEILACPICKSQLIFNKELNELVFKADKLAYAIKNDIPVRLENEARQLTLEELEQIK